MSQLDNATCCCNQENKDCIFYTSLLCYFKAPVFLLHIQKTCLAKKKNLGGEMHFLLFYTVWSTGQEMIYHIPAQAFEHIKVMDSSNMPWLSTTVEIMRLLTCKAKPFCQEWKCSLNKLTITIHSHLLSNYYSCWWCRDLISSSRTMHSTSHAIKKKINQDQSELC